MNIGRVAYTRGLRMRGAIDSVFGDRAVAEAHAGGRGGVDFVEEGPGCG